ncbi:non-ribosomal peptide synthetase [Acidovorax cavernicola]|uniref:Non-ribosomal peptide synthetase n=2 Tax=Acidovorax cavernicola TaxID=1675792 RepID=A0A9X8D549_9BURK|nr:non-ribosomal peptide synthetase [Acidovorax cavernicola]
MTTMTEHFDETTFPLSPEQRAVPADAPNLLLRADIEGALDTDRLRDVVTRVLSAHGALCSAIRAVPGYRGLRQQYTDGMAPLAWANADLRDAPESGLAEWLANTQAAPLDIARGEMVRAGLARAGEARHSLALVVHARVGDRGSLQHLFDQIATAFADADSFDAAEVFPYARFVTWRQDLLDGEDAAEGRAYWQRYLAQAASLTPPRLVGRQAGVAQQAARVHADDAFDAGFAGRIAACADALGAQPDTLLQAVWWLLLARLDGIGRFAAGWQHDCRRDYPPMQGAVGVFDKVLPLIVETAPETRFADWFDNLDGTLAAHVEAQEYWAVEAPPIAAHLAVGFACHERPLGHGVDLQWQLATLPAPLPNFELALQVAWDVDGAALSVHADAARHSEAAAQRLLMQYRCLLEAVVERPDTALGALPLVGARERDLLLQSQEAVADVGTQTVTQRIAHWAAETPDAPALEAGGQRLSYRELDQRIGCVAHWLQGQGVTAGAIVALNLPRAFDLPVAILAVWRAGAAYLPLDPDWPEARRAAVLADAMPVFTIDAALPDAAALPETLAAPHAAAPSDLAYVLYTSGSTGTPKGVAVEQGQLQNYVAAASAAMKLETCRRWALTSSVAADLGNTALFGAFYNGACLVVAAPHEAKDAEAFARFMSAHAIDALKIVPSHLEALLEGAAPSLPRTLVLGGEAAPRALVERIAKLAPQCAIYNHYGPTEATVGVMVHAVEAGAPVPEQLPLTRVLANNRVRVLDASRGLVPAGGLGEVYIGGAQLCRGYLNRANADAGDVFVADPFRAGERLYRTGDLAWVLPEGGLRLAGRADHQVKVHGYRVEPAEIEAALLARPGVRQAVVLAVPDAAGATTLAAFFVGDSEAADGRALREQLGALLPAHMVPASCTAVSAFARLPNGKIDRLALAASAPTDAPQRAIAPPRDALEALLADGMATLLGSGPVGVEDDFFELGGHSLQVIKLVARIRKLLQVEVAAGVVFDHPTPAALAAVLREASADAAALEQLAQAHRQRDLADESVGEAA